MFGGVLLERTALRGAWWAFGVFGYIRRPATGDRRPATGDRRPATRELVPNYIMPTINADAHPLMKRMQKPTRSCRSIRMTSGA